MVCGMSSPRSGTGSTVMGKLREGAQTGGIVRSRYQRGGSLELHVADVIRQSVDIRPHGLAGIRAYKPLDRVPNTLTSDGVALTSPAARAGRGCAILQYELDGVSTGDQTPPLGHVEKYACIVVVGLIAEGGRGYALRRRFQWWYSRAWRGFATRQGVGYWQALFVGCARLFQHIASKGLFEG